MTPERKQHLYDQYVLAIVNDGDWYRLAAQYIPQHAREFARKTYVFVNKIGRELREPALNYSERAYVYYECWRHYGGNRDQFMRNQCDGIAGAMSCITEYGAPSQHPVSQPEPPQEEPAMNQTTPAFQTRHFVYGMDVDNMSAGQLIEAIKKIEAEIADLKLVKSKSEHIKKRIAELEDMLAKVVQVLDAK